MTEFANTAADDLRRDSLLAIFLCGDVMTGRGIDQILPHPCNPVLFEGYVNSAIEYVELAERKNGPIPRRADFSYIWGDALEIWEAVKPDTRIINLETSITHSENYMPKGINYRMSPENIGCLLAARIDCCALANNHVLDWGRAGLLETLEVLEHHGVRAAGAGRDRAQASAPAIIEMAGKGRVLVLSMGSTSSGIPWEWAATHDRAGVNVVELSDATVEALARSITPLRKPGDVVIVSIHWGPNWGYRVPPEQRRFAQALIDRANVSIVHGHSSHHVKAIEAYKNRLILYGCGDFINDYEGIGGYEAFRDDLAIMYFAYVDMDSADLVRLEMFPLVIKRFRLGRASAEDRAWLRDVLDRESRQFNTRVDQAADGRFLLSWK